MNKKDYKSRIIDRQIESYLFTFKAICINQNRRWDFCSTNNGIKGVKQ